jgi:protein required for attachment to host cells
MLVSHATTIAVADGATLELYRNGGDEARPKLIPLPAPKLATHSKDSGKRHRSSTANPDDENVGEDSFVAAIADWLNAQALEGKIEHLIVVAAPKALGELRRHYHKALSGKLVAELDKDLVGRPVAEIEAALNHAKAS